MITKTTKEAKMNKVTRVKNKNYTVISNVFLRDEKLSLKAKGLLATILSLPETWDFSIKGICSVVKEGTTAVYSAIDELKKCGYCSIIKNRNEKGMIIGNDYTFYENPHMENLNMDNQKMDNQTQINTNNISIDKDNKKEKNKEEIKELKELKEKFTNFVSLYKQAGGKVRGVETEFRDFSKRHKDWQSVVPYLELALKREIKERNQAKIERRFFPEIKMLKTYLGQQRAWEMYVTIGEKIDTETYTPQGRTIWFNEETKSYWSMDNFYYGVISDGYTDDNRPNGATITLNNGRGRIQWDAKSKEWIKQ